MKVEKIGMGVLRMENVRRVIGGYVFAEVTTHGALAIVPATLLVAVAVIVDVIARRH